MQITSPLFNNSYSHQYNTQTTDPLFLILLATLNIGQVAGYVAEEMASRIFSGFVTKAPPNTKGYDLISVKSNRKIEVKILTKNGVKLCPSSQVGKGRKYDHQAFLLDAPSRDYIIVDAMRIAEGYIEFVIHSGSSITHMANESMFKNASMNYKKARKVLFDDDEPSSVIVTW